MEDGRSGPPRVDQSERRKQRGSSVNRSERPSRRSRCWHRDKFARSGRRARPAGAQRGSFWQTAPLFRCSSHRVVASSPFLAETRRLRGTARCIRKASSYDLIRARALASSGYSAATMRSKRSSKWNSSCCSSWKARSRGPRVNSGCNNQWIISVTQSHNAEDAVAAWVVAAQPRHNIPDRAQE
jgi:hypothetical protein